MFSVNVFVYFIARFVVKSKFGCSTLPFTHAVRSSSSSSSSSGASNLFQYMYACVHCSMRKQAVGLTSGSAFI